MLSIVKRLPLSLPNANLFMFGSRKSPHQILGIHKNANKTQIKQAFNRLAKTYHPDFNSNPSENQKFASIRQAYEQMMNLCRAEPKEQKNHSYKERNDFRNDHQFDEFSEAFQQFIRGGYVKKKYRNFQFWFREMFEEQRRPNNRSHERDDSNYYYPNRFDITKRISIDFAETGTQKMITFMRQVLCRKCEGNLKKCKVCKGRGKNGTFGECFYCNGTGKSKKSKCEECKGKGVLAIKVQELIAIPEHLSHHDSILIKGKGHQDPKKGSFGNLILQFIVRRDKSKKNQKKGVNSYEQYSISIVQAVLGSSPRIETLGGRKKVNIPNGVQDGQVLKVVGGGYEEKHKNRRGDLFLKLKVRIPENLSLEERQLFEKLRQIQQKL